MRALQCRAAFLVYLLIRFTVKGTTGPAALGAELSAELLRAGRTGVPLVCCEVCTHNSQPFSSYDFGRPSPDGLEHAAAAAERAGEWVHV